MAASDLEPGPSRSAEPGHERQLSTAGALFGADTEDTFALETRIFELVTHIGLLSVAGCLEDVVVRDAVLWDRIGVLGKIGGTLGPDQTDEHLDFVFTRSFEASEAGIAAFWALGKVGRGRGFAPLGDGWWFAAPRVTRTEVFGGRFTGSASARTQAQTEQPEGMVGFRHTRPRSLTFPDRTRDAPH